MLRFAFLVVTLLTFSLQPAPAGADFSSVSIESSLRSTTTSRNAKKQRRQKQRQKARRTLQRAIKTLRRLARSLPSDQQDSIDAIISSLQQARKSAKKAKTQINQITKSARQVQKATQSLIKDIRQNGVENVDLETELSNLEDGADDVGDSVDNSTSGGGSGSATGVNIRALPLLEEFYTTDTFPSDVARLPNIEGIGDAFSAQELFFESADNFTTLSTAISSQPTNDQCGSFASTDQDGSIGGYESCRSVSAFSGPVADMATAATDLCIASVAITAETLNRGVTRTSGSTKPNALFNNNGIVQLSLFDGRTIYVQNGTTNSIGGSTTIWSCASGGTTSDRITLLNVSRTAGRATFTGTYGDELLSADLQFLLTEGDDGELVPTGDVTSRILKVSGEYFYDNYLKFSRDDVSDAYSEIIDVAGGSATFFENRTVPGQFYMTGFDRLRVDGFFSTASYTNSSNATSQGYDFGTRSYVTDSTRSSLESSFDSTDALYTAAANGSTVELDAGTVSNAQVACTPDGSVSAVFSIDLTAAKVQEAIEACTAIPSVGDACSADSSIVAAGVNFSANCSS